MTEEDVTPSEDVKPPEDVPPVSAERLVDGEVAYGPDAEPRRYPSTIGGAFYLVVLALTLVGLGLAYSSDWRTGIRWISGALGFAALIRLVLRSRDAGMLAVRAKWLDVVLISAVGIMLAMLAESIPDQPVP